MTLISQDELVSLRETESAVRLLDVRWRLDLPEGRPAYLDGHLPGAVYVDLQSELAEPPDPAEGLHPLPTKERLQRAVQRWGINDGDTIVIYDDVHSVAASRAWWLLSNSGVGDVRILDGGLRGWVAAGLELARGDVQLRPGTAVISELAAPIVTLNELDTISADTVLIDVRNPQRYRGDPTDDERISGHLPGAVNLQTTVHLDAGRFREPAEIARNLASRGVDHSTNAVVYCGSGIAATHTIFAASLAGLDLALYPGGWSQWSQAAGRWAVTGPHPHGNRERV